MSLRGKRWEQIQRTGVPPGLGAWSYGGAQVSGWTQGSPVSQNHWNTTVRAGSGGEAASRGSTR